MKECIYCKSNSFLTISKRVRDSSKHSIIKCIKCHLVQLFPIPSSHDDKSFYNKGRQFTNIHKNFHIKTLRVNQRADTFRRANLISKLAPKKSIILDVGSGFGFFIEEMKKRDYCPQGIEISDFARNISQKITKEQVFDIDILRDSFLKQYDVITMFHVLEHLSKPVIFLKKLKKMIAKPGKLIIEVPNLNDLMVSSNISYRQFYWQRAHLLYLNKETISILLESAGFSEYEFWYTQRYGLSNFMNWMMNNSPQIDKPTFETHGNYDWLENLYKKELIKTGKSDTLTVVVNN